ncbi:MAG: hypothetical protein ACKPKO_38940, partial [Candidatus Fonsibacter sp.]
MLLSRVVEEGESGSPDELHGDAVATCGRASATSTGSSTPMAASASTVASRSPGCAMAASAQTAAPWPPASTTADHEDFDGDLAAAIELSLRLAANAEQVGHDDLDVDPAA